jgi:hypothetical protein
MGKKSHLNHACFKRQLWSKKKLYVTLTPVSVIKLFFSIAEDRAKYAGVFVPGNQFPL